MDFIVCYPWHKEGEWGDELKYSLRSIDKYLSGNYEVWLFLNHRNFLPEWIKGVHYKNEDWLTEHAKGHTMINKVRQLYVANRIKLPFVWMNDDIYLLKPTTLADLSENYVINKPQIFEWPDTSSWWKTLLLDTAKLLKEKGVKTFWCADTHLPYVYDPSLYRNMIDIAGRMTKFASQTFYFNLYLNGASVTTDVNIKSGYYFKKDKPFEIKETHRYLNHNDTGLKPEIVDFIKTTFSEKSRYEK